MRDQVEAEEEDGVPERATRDLGIERDVDGGEADRRQDADREERGELAVAEGQRESPQMTSAAAISSTMSPISTSRTRRASAAGGVAAGAGS
jgi:hypothetical protein